MLRMGEAKFSCIIFLENIKGLFVTCERRTDDTIKVEFKEIRLEDFGMN